MRIVSILVTIILSFSLLACADGGIASNDERLIDSQDFSRAEVIRVVDGDTLIVRLSSGDEDRLRLIGINAHESVAPDESRNTKEGELASDFMKSLVEPGDEVWLVRDVSERDQYERLLRYVWLELPEDPYDKTEVATKMVNGILVAQGHAQAKDYAPDSSYKEIFKEIEVNAAPAFAA
ncbi:MAG: thermonuclease family protein [Raoultibacter sp.]|jgi:micrococcal nuclease